MMIRRTTFRSWLMVVCCVVGVAWGASPGFAVGPDGLGASLDAAGKEVTFRVFSNRATRVEVWVYQQPSGEAEKAKVEMTVDPVTKIWSKTVAVADLTAAGVGATIHYGYRAWGANWTFDAAWTKGSHAGFVSDVDDQGNRFNPNKLLLDPYALEVSHDPLSAQVTSDAIYLSGPQRDQDSGLAAPKGIVLRPAPADATGKPTRAFKDDVIYEVHVRGLTKNDRSVPAELRGTYAGAARKASYLKSLGVTAIELLPVQEVQNDQNDLVASTDGDDYWGYNPLNYFSPDRRYAADRTPGGPTREFQAMTKAFHQQGIKVYIDVVYNHTGEGGVGKDPTIARLHSFRGLDNAAYYELAEKREFYFDSNGVGGNFNAAHPRVRQLVIDSLTHWKQTLGVDGFRFDLAPVLGNTCQEGCFFFNKFDPQNVLNRAVTELPVRPDAGGPGIDLIAEPWAIGNGTYQVGQFPSHWAEWNDKFRDTIRVSQNRLGVSNVPPAELSRRIAGSSDLFQDDGRKPFHSLNFLVAHDGFCLRDLYSFNSKQNTQPFPFGPSDGGNDNNIAWDQGGNAALQRQAARNGLALLMLSAGVPMITGGDEMFRTQFGNNNAYNLDTEKNHLDWDDATRFPHFLSYSKKLIGFRRTHPALRPAEFFKGSDSNNNGLKDITWFRDTGTEADGGYMDNAENHFLAYRLDGTEMGDSAHSLYVAYNGWSSEVTATLPANSTGKRWFRVADTDQWMENQDNFKAPGAEDLLNDPKYKLHPRSVLVLIEK